MTPRLLADRRRAPRAPSRRRAQDGMVARGLVVVTGLVAAVVLQLAGPRLQCHLAELVGLPSAAPAPAPASMPSCGTPAADNAMRPCKVATMAAADAAFAPKF